MTRPSLWLAAVWLSMLHAAWGVGASTQHLFASPPLSTAGTTSSTRPRSTRCALSPPSASAALPACYPFCASSSSSSAHLESLRYSCETVGNLGYVDPLIGTQGADPSEYGGMVPSVSLPFASTRLVPMTRENAVSAVPYHYNDTASIGAFVTRQPAIWMGDYGHLALWSTARGEPVQVELERRRKAFDRSKDEFASVWKYAVRLGDEQTGEDQVYMELAGKSRAQMVQFTYPDPVSSAATTAQGTDGERDRIEDDDDERGPAVTLQASRPSWRGGVDIDPRTGQVSGYNTERMDFRLGPHRALDFKGWFVARFEYQLKGSDTWTPGFSTDAQRGYGTVHTNSSGATLHRGQRARWNDLGVYGYVRFPARTKRVRVRIGMSLISKHQAEFNLEDEMPDSTDLEDVVRGSIQAWREKVDRIHTEGGTEKDKTVLYTAMVRTSAYPSEHAEAVPPAGWRPCSDRASSAAVASPEAEAGGERRYHYYSAYTSSIHAVPQGQGEQRYQSFSIWDIYRAQWSTLILFEPARVVDMVRSLLDIYDQSGFLPQWANLAETNVMIGTHADSLLAEAAVKGVRGFDLQKAWEAVYKDATVPPEGERELRFADREEYTPLEVRAGLSAYRELGYVPLDGWDESTSRTLDYAYDDAAVAVLAKAVGNRTREAAYFEQRSKTNWKEVFDPQTGMACARLSNGSFLRQRLDTPQGRQEGFTEGNMFDYTFAVPHDVAGLVEHLSPARLAELLRRHFEEGHNNISNEPSQHIPYLYSYLGKHGETHRLVRSILREGYGDDEGSITGNEDCGQMSSWFVWNAAVGVYPMNPMSGELVVGGGMAFDEVRIIVPRRGEGQEEGETRLVIRAAGVSEGKVYTRGVEVNGKKRGAVLRWEDVVRGGEWVFDMAERPGEWVG
ncbi:hypothetical protein ACQY0O_002170 [Thecaphora frezii]